MAYVFKLPPTVTEAIMRLAIGYPSDRVRAIAADVRRIECRYHVFWKLQNKQITESFFFKRDNLDRVGEMFLSWHEKKLGRPTQWRYLEDDREGK